jgi:hypothetical protein
MSAVYVAWTVAFVAAFIKPPEWLELKLEALRSRAATEESS